MTVTESGTRPGPGEGHSPGSARAASLVQSQARDDSRVPCRYGWMAGMLHTVRVRRARRAAGSTPGPTRSAPGRRTSDSFGLRGTELALAVLFRVPVLLSAQADPAVPTRPGSATPTRGECLVPGLGPTVQKFHFDEFRHDRRRVVSFFKNKTGANFFLKIVFIFFW